MLFGFFKLFLFSLLFIGFIFLRSFEFLFSISIKKGFFIDSIIGNFDSKKKFSFIFFISLLLFCLILLNISVGILGVFLVLVVSMRLGFFDMLCVGNVVFFV